MKQLLALFLVACPLLAAAQPEIKPHGALPSPAQVKWQQLEYYMFIHFGPNTFTDKEWGHGDEDPKVFNPTDLDARQWAKTAKLAGMKGIIITAKHHDGFCLWPSEYSKHTVRESAWKNGKGDVLAELSAACKEYGLLFGVYLSPWDRNHPAYGTPEYNQVFANQLREVHTKYGDVFEQWFDGANGEGPNGKKQVYDWDLFHNTVRKYHPNVIFFSDAGPGCRWIGNERGYAGETNWSTLNAKDFAPGMSGIQETLNRGQEGGTDWVPGEADVSIRPGWFYSPKTDDKVKTLPQLLNIYYASVGRNANLLLNVPVDRRGRIHANDSTRLMELRRALDADFANNLVRSARISATNTRPNSPMTSAVYLGDNSYNTYWAAAAGTKSASITLSWSKPVTFNQIELQEFIPLGQRVKAFSVSILKGKVYVPLNGAEATTIGYKRILKFADATAKSIRIDIKDAVAEPVLSEVRVYHTPARLSDLVIKRDANGLLDISCETPGPDIRYTLDGSEPTLSSPKYAGPAPFTVGTVKARAFINGGKQAGSVVTARFGYPPALFSTTPAMSKAVDGNPATAATADTYPAELVVDLRGRVQAELNGFIYTPKSSGGIIAKYAVYVSNDGRSWGQPVAEGSFANILNSPVAQYVNFSKPVKCGFVKFVALAPADAKETKAAIAEFGLF
ncbi:alpha-L-fucosidase [Chitinophaga lutea]